MTAVLDLLKLAASDAQIIAAGETPSAEDTQVLLDTLNQMMSLWQLPGTFHGFRFPVYQKASDDLQLPIEFEMPIRFNLGIKACAAFSVPVRADLAREASTTLRTLKRAYMRIPELVIPCELLPRWYWWYDTGCCQWQKCPC